MRFSFQQTFMENEFTGLHSLSVLYLQHNQIKSLGTALQNLTKLVVLNITHNGIKLIKPDQVPKTLKTIYLEGEFLLISFENKLNIWSPKNLDSSPGKIVFKMKWNFEGWTICYVKVQIKVMCKVIPIPSEMYRLYYEILW